jgi:hypothetical protein
MASTMLATHVAALRPAAARTVRAPLAPQLVG